MVSGASGTVGRALVHTLEAAGHTCIPYDRAKAGVSDYDRMNAYLQDEKPEAFYHLAVASKSTGLDNESWIVNYEWPSNTT